MPRHLRWFVKFSESESLEEYARQLDYFKVELGVVLLDPGARKLVYISNLSRNPPTKREVTGSAKDDQRLYFTWEGGLRKDADVKLCARAGVQAERGILLHFYSPQLEEQLATLERQYRNRNPKEIRRTYFLIVKSGNAYTFKVTGQTYLK